VDTVRDPLLVLGDDLNILFASNSFYRLFLTGSETLDKQHLFKLDEGPGYSRMA
jgi:hypothetical protein